MIGLDWHRNNLAEQKIELRFWQEVGYLPTLRVTHFKLWEGDSMVTVMINEEKSVSFWYGEDGVPTITSIGGESTEFECIIDGDSHVTTGLRLSKNSELAYHFGFEINSLADLTRRYQDLVTRWQELKNDDESVLFTFKSKYGEARCGQL